MSVEIMSEGLAEVMQALRKKAADDKIKQIYEEAKSAMNRLSDENYKYITQDCVYEDLRKVKKLVESFEEGEWYWKNKEDDEH